MTGLPTDAAGLAVFVIDILIQTMSVDEAVQRLSTWGLNSGLDLYSRHFSKHGPRLRGKHL
jgi:hypothetical protein